MHNSIEREAHSWQPKKVLTAQQQNKAARRPQPMWHSMRARQSARKAPPRKAPPRKAIPRSNPAWNPMHGGSIKADRAACRYAMPDDRTSSLSLTTNRLLGPFSFAEFIDAWY